MRVLIQDNGALTAVSPAALSAYARSAGWEKYESYGDYSDVYVREDAPEVILPRTQNLADYAMVVSRLIDIFAMSADTDQMSLYHELLTSDRDVIKVRADCDFDGYVLLKDGIKLMQGGRQIVVAAACSLGEPQPFYASNKNKDATKYVDDIRLGQTEQDSFVIDLISPVVSPLRQLTLDLDEAVPMPRRVSERLTGALQATSVATKKWANGDEDALYEAVPHGISANLCDGLVKLIKPFDELDISLIWARTYPTNRAKETVSFTKEDASILEGAVKTLRNREPQLGTKLFGYVHSLKRAEKAAHGTITLKASINDATQSVTAVLNQSDYERAIQAHKNRSPVLASGDLDGTGQRWHLKNPHIDLVVTA